MDKSTEGNFGAATKVTGAGGSASMRAGAQFDRQAGGVGRPEVRSGLETTPQKSRVRAMKKSAFLNTVWRRKST